MSNSQSNRFDEFSNTGHRWRTGWIAAVCAMLIAASATAQVPMKSISETLESGTGLVTLPGVPGGTLTVSECRECKSHRLSFAPGTRYFLGKEPVTYARLLEAASKGDFRLYASYRLDDRTLTRLRLVATGNEK